MTPRGSADVLSRTTAIVAVLFVITSISLTVLSLRSSERTLNFDETSINESSDTQIEDLPEFLS